MSAGSGVDRARPLGSASALPAGCGVQINGCSQGIGSMMRLRWSRRLAAILGVALVAAVGAAALPDHPYQRWQLIENTLYANATWSYERITFDPRPIDVAIIGASRAQLGLSAPRIAERLAAAGLPLEVANLSVIEEGRNMEWAIVNELFKRKRPKVLVVSITERYNRWGHPGFKYVAPTSAIVAPPAPFLHNWFSDLPYLPYRQLMLFTASLAPSLFDLRDGFDAQRYAAKPVDYTQSHVLTDGRRIDMDRTVAADDLRAESRAFEAIRKPSSLPARIAAITDRDNSVYVAAITRLAARHGTRLIFLFLPEFDGPTTIEGRTAYARLGQIEDYGDFAHDSRWFQSFAHLNHRGAIAASDRLAAAIIADLGATVTAGDKTASGMGDQQVTRSADNGATASAALY